MKKHGHRKHQDGTAKAKQTSKKFVRQAQRILCHQVVVEHVHVLEHQNPSDESYLYWMLLS